VRAAGVQIEVHVRHEVHLVDENQIGHGEHVRILQRFVGTLGDRDDHHLAALAEVEQRRADQVTDVLHEHQGARCRIQLVQCVPHHRGIQVAAGPGVDLHHVTPRTPDPIRVQRRLLVALHDRHRPARPEVADGPFQQRGLAGTRRTHQVDRHDAATGQPLAVGHGQRVVLSQYLLFESDGLMRMITMLVDLAAPTGRAHPSAHLHGDDLQLASGGDLEIGTSARAQQNRIRRSHLDATFTAMRGGRSFLDVQSGAVRHSSLRGQLPAEPHRGRNHRG